MDFPINSMVIFHSYVSLPEGNSSLAEFEGPHCEVAFSSMLGVIISKNVRFGPKVSKSHIS